MIRIEPDKKNGLSKISAIDCFQVRSVATARFIKRIGIVDAYIISEIEKSLTLVLKIRESKP